MNAYQTLCFFFVFLIFMILINYETIVFHRINQYFATFLGRYRNNFWNNLISFKIILYSHRENVLKSCKFLWSSIMKNVEAFNKEFILTLMKMNKKQAKGIILRIITKTNDRNITSTSSCVVQHTPNKFKANT